MTHSDSITLLLDLKASDLTFPLDNFVKEGFSKLTGPNKALIFKATYQPKQTICPACGVIASTRPVRAYNVSEVLLTPSGHRPRVLSLTKAKYDCTDCGTYFTPIPYFIEVGATISSVVKAAIFLDLRVKMSMKDVARRYFVSPAFCWKILDQIPLKQPFRRLPEVLCFDEFKATQNSRAGLDDRAVGRVPDRQHHYRFDDSTDPADRHHESYRWWDTTDLRDVCCSDPELWGGRAAALCAPCRSGRTIHRRRHGGLSELFPGHVSGLHLDSDTAGHRCPGRSIAGGAGAAVQQRAHHGAR